MPKRDISSRYTGCIARRVAGSWTENPVDVSAESLDDLRWVLDRMRDALSRPILEERNGELYVVE